MSRRRAQFARGHEGDVHPATAQDPRIAAQMPRDHQYSFESPQSGVERRTHNVTRWRDAEMVQRWVASAWQLTEKHFRRIDGYADLWSLAAILGRETNSTNQPSKEKVA